MSLGVATIKVRVPEKNSGGRLITIQLKLDVLVEDLYTEIAAKLNLQSNRYVFFSLKIACSNSDNRSDFQLVLLLHKTIDAFFLFVVNFKVEVNQRG